MPGGKGSANRPSDNPSDDLVVLPADHQEARDKLLAYANAQMKWDDRGAALLVEYASLAVDSKLRSHPRDAAFVGFFPPHEEFTEFVAGNLGPLSAVGAQKATQFLAELAGRFAPAESAGYEAIFSAWGGDVRERSLDLATGELRPREISIDLPKEGSPLPHVNDPTVYARVDYLQPKGLSPREVACCKTILKNLKVIFTFAPMNLLNYRVEFPPHQQRRVVVSYDQYAYADTRQPKSFQLAYVLHPASMWKDFGPIHLEVVCPDGVKMRASAPCTPQGTPQASGNPDPTIPPLPPIPLTAYRGTVTQKTGELFVALDADEWEKAVAGNGPGGVSSIRPTRP